MAEIEALQAIFDTDFVLHSTSELAAATKAIENGDPTADDIEFHVSLQLGTIMLQCRLPAGYPITKSARVSIDARTRKEQEELTRRIQEKANEIVGEESILVLVHELQALVDAIEAYENDNNTEKEIETTSKPKTLERRWVWVHHITDTARRKAIIQEARELELGGYLKWGYPGIVVVEGEHCDEFVTWIKGNKSRPGGFGRNWGHHVRFQAEITARQLPLEFTEFEDMKDLGAACKECGLEEEFLENVMQHK